MIGLDTVEKQYVAVLASRLFNTKIHLITIDIKAKKTVSSFYRTQLMSVSCRSTKINRFLNICAIARSKNSSPSLGATNHHHLLAYWILVKNLCSSRDDFIKMAWNKKHIFKLPCLQYSIYCFSRLYRINNTENLVFNDMEWVVNFNNTQQLFFITPYKFNYIFGVHYNTIYRKFT